MSPMKKSKRCRFVDGARSVPLALGTALSALLLASPAWAGHEEDTTMALEYHGFASVGYIASRGNHFYGDTQHGGAADYYETGVNGFATLNHHVSVAGQILARKAGNTDDGQARVDYGFVDVHAPRNGELDYGLRVGRVRNPFGLYNETRDVVFTRPSILLPQSVYFEGNGIRELLFSSDAVQLYGSVAGDEHLTSFKVSQARSGPASDLTLRNLTGGTIPANTDARVVHPLFAQVLHERGHGRQRYAYSYANLGMRGALSGDAFDLQARVSIWSAQFNEENWSLTSEYQRTDIGSVVAGLASRNRSDGIYVQYQYRFSPQWTGLLRHDVSYGDRDNRSIRVSRDTAVGLIWRPRDNVQVNAEYHLIRGVDGIPLVDNPNGRTARTDLLALMVGLRF